jgi:hypothetical protein
MILTDLLISFMGNKKIALISTFCDTNYKKEILHENILKIKELGIDVMIISPNFIEIPKETIEISDFCFYTKENPLLKWPVRQYTHWYEMPIGNGKITTLHRGFADYGWAALYQTKKLSQIALTFDYDIFYHIIYDLEIDSVVECEFLSNEVNLIHPRRDPHHPDTLWETTLHFMVFDRDMMEKIEKDIQLDEYLRTNGVAEGEVLKWTKKYDIKISDHPIKDKIFYWENFDFFNMSPFKDFKMFISKNEPIKIWIGEGENSKSEILTSNLRIVFHSFEKMSEIDVIINNVTYTINPKKWEINEFPVDSQSIQSVKFNYNGYEVDYTNEFNNIMMNQVYYNYR